MLQSRNRRHQRRLHIFRQRCRDAVRIDRRVVETFRLEKNLMPVALAEAHDLVFDRRAIARTRLLIWPEYIGERCTLARMTSWVAALVRVIPHWICGVVMRSVSTENGSGGSSPGCISTADQSMVVPSSRGGVPVFSRPSANPARSRVRERPIAGASPTRPAGICCSPIWIRPRRNVPVVSTTAPQSTIRPIRQPDAADLPGSIMQIVDFGFDHGEIGRARGSPAAWPPHRACDRPGRAGRARPGPLRRLSTRN